MKPYSKKMTQWAWACDSKITSIYGGKRANRSFKRSERQSAKREILKATPKRAIK